MVLDPILDWKIWAGRVVDIVTGVKLKIDNAFY